MKLSKLFLFTMIVGSLAVIGCGNDGGGGAAGSGGSGTAGTGGSGTAGTGGSGTAGTGGSGTAGTGGGNGAPVSTCDALCGDSPCGDADEPDCEQICAEAQPSYATDNCGGLLQAFLECAEPGCGPLEFWECRDFQIQWDACAN